MAKTFFSLGLIWLVLQKSWSEIEQGGPELRDLLSSVDLTIFSFAVLLNALSFVGSAYQWHKLLVYQDVKIAWLSTLKNYFVGLFFNHFLLGNAGGDVQKVVDVHRQSNQWKQGLMATLFDRIFGLYVINCFALVVGWVYFASDDRLKILVWPSSWLFLFMSIFFCILFSRRLSKLSLSWIGRIPKLESVYEQLEVIVERFGHYRQNYLVLKLIAFSVLIQLVRIFVHYAVGLSLGIDLEFIYYLYFIPIIGIVSALPISMGGFGPREYLAQTLFLLVGISAAGSILIQLLALMSAFIPSLIGGWIFMRRRNAPNPKEVDNGSSIHC